MSKLEALNKTVEQIKDSVGEQEVQGNEGQQVQQQVQQPPQQQVSQSSQQQVQQQVSQPSQQQEQEVQQQTQGNGKEVDRYDDISNSLDDLYNDIVLKHSDNSGEKIVEQNTENKEQETNEEKSLENEEEMNINNDEEDDKVLQLKAKLEDERFKRLQVEVERDRYKELYQAERAKVDEFLQKSKDLERNLKKLETQIVPEDIKDLVEYYRLAREAGNMYNIRNYVAKALQTVEQFTSVPTEGYILEWLKRGDLLQTEGQPEADKSNLTPGPNQQTDRSSIVKSIMT